MITVEPPTTNHRFPVLDFKFQNTGHAAAVLWKFCLVIEHVEIDPQPALSSQVRVHDPVQVQNDNGYHSIGETAGKTLGAAVTNNGWGAAIDCTIILLGPILDRLFPADARKLTVSIPAGETRDLLISHASLNREEFVKLVEASREQANDRFESELPNLIDDAVEFERTSSQSFSAGPLGIWKKLRVRMKKDNFDEANARRTAEDRLRAKFAKSWSSRGSIQVPMELEYSLRDERNRRFSGLIRPDMGGHIGGHIEVFSDGFIHKEHFALASASFPDTIYSCIIDVDRGAHSREYPISRVVPSGDAEHFQVVVGATKSSHLKIKFQFYVDKATIVESKPFFLELWNPRSSGWHTRYKDGDIVRSIAKAASAKSDKALTWEERDALRNKAALDDFPFLSPRPSLEK